MGTSLTLEQCQENLRYLLDVRARRLDALADLLSRFDIDLRSGMAEDDPHELLAALDRWARAEWPTAREPWFSDDTNAWSVLQKDGQHIVLAMLMDVAIVLGEMVIARSPGYEWRLDLAPEHQALDSYRRVVVSRDNEDRTPLDFEHECVDMFDWLGRGVPVDPLGSTVLETLYPDAVDKVDSPHVRDVDGPHVYDKAKYHDDSLMDEYGFTDEQACIQAAVPTAFFFGWLASRGLLDSTRDVDAYVAGHESAVDLYYRYDGCLIDYMLTDEGNAFARSYFTFTWPPSGYMEDLEVTLAQGLPSVFHIPYSVENQEHIDAVIDRRFAQWRTEHGSTPADPSPNELQ